jgi:hypothetical protein
MEPQILVAAVLVEKIETVVLVVLEYPLCVIHVHR